MKRVGKTVSRGWQAKFFGGQAANALAIHGQLGSPCNRDDGSHPFSFDLRQGFRSDGLDFRNHELRLFLLDQLSQLRGIGHIDGMGPVGYLVPRCIRVSVNCDDLDTQPLQGDDYFLAELAGAEQHDSGCCR